jgi:hypothetical protein
LQESLALARTKQNSWITDLRIVLSRLYIPVDLNIQPNLDVATVEVAMKDVKTSMEAWIDNEIESSSRVPDMLVGRLEKDKDTSKLVKKTLDFRHYLRIKQPEHRKALRKLNLSSHSLAVERRRWKERGKNIVPRQWRLCRFCYVYVEDPAHALFVCQHEELKQHRQEFLAKVNGELPNLVQQFPQPLELFRALLSRREITPLLGKLAYIVLQVFDSTPMLIVSDPGLQPLVTVV